MKQGVVRPETPAERRERELLQEDVEDSPLAGGGSSTGSGTSGPIADSYLAALGGPLPYMTRLRAIHVQTAEHERQLEAARLELADDVEPTTRRSRGAGARWPRWNFYEVNDLIARHNRWYPVEARLPMDPKTGDYALVNGEDYRRRPLDAEWVLERFPARLPRAAAA